MVFDTLVPRCAKCWMWELVNECLYVLAMLYNIMWLDRSYGQKYITINNILWQTMQCEIVARIQVPVYLASILVDVK